MILVLNTLLSLSSFVVCRVTPFSLFGHSPFPTFSLCATPFLRHVNFVYYSAGPEVGEASRLFVEVQKRTAHSIRIRRRWDKWVQADDSHK